MQRLPDGFLEQIVEYRNYRNAKALVDAADSAEAVKRLPATELVQLARVIEFELAEEEMHGGGSTGN